MMKTQSADTHPKAEAVQIQLIRQASVAQRIARMRSLTSSLMRLSKRAIRRANPAASQNEIDVFLLKSTSYDREAFQRRRKDVLDEEQDIELFLASPEDIILHKLDWFRMGGGVSERQWTDVMGVLKVQQGHLDMAYLRHWAAELGLSDLFTQVCRDTGIDEENPDENRSYV